MNTVAQAFAESVRRHAARTAVIAEDGMRLSYAELDQLRLYAARALLTLGIQHGDRVAIWRQPGSLDGRQLAIGLDWRQPLRTHGHRQQRTGRGE